MIGSASYPKNDFAFTASCLATYGLVVLLGYLLLDTKHHQRSGAADGKKARAADRLVIQYFKEAWPGVFEKHPTRANEVQMGSKDASYRFFRIFSR